MARQSPRQPDLYVMRRTDTGQFDPYTILGVVTGARNARRRKKAPVENQDNYRKTLLYAEALAGSPAQLARLLSVDSRRLSMWFRGTEPIPEGVFLKLVDIVLDATREDVERSRSYQHHGQRPDHS
jgi:hypothetical protein